MSIKYENCRESIILENGAVFRNRIFFAAMGIDCAQDDGSFSQSLYEFYAGIIRGGVGAVVFANASISKSSRLKLGGLLLTTAAHANALQPIIDYANDQRCVAIIQLQHYGAQGLTELTGSPLLAPTVSMAARNGSAPMKAMSHSDINGVVDQFANAAIRAETIGAGGIQIQASNGYLISSFLSPFSNLRNDEYGGDIIGRARFLLEIVKAIRSCLSRQTMVSVRLNVDDVVDFGGVSLEDVIETVHMLKMSGCDLVELSCCVRQSFKSLITPSHSFIDMVRSKVRAVRASSSLPISYAGGTRSLLEAESLLTSATCDLVGMSRALFADNDLVRKSLANREHDISACLFEGNCFRDKSNPLADRVYCCVSKIYPRPSHIKY
ncbi:NADH:flavin oxidoreductase [Achromobacter sp. Marseille-Q0513]|uniref:NADH:flavin oxidoreductase n=1 Tax=Achromobacter sp. Marseille-Q0513 TaxID=2829161 RepID=UPI001B954E1C|nr:NADH:flavin oxidoreductase [Achromobacter sp. Marseille-Q0513]MBR8653832.1 NADH:flavin oxidoreductase [Achromobacter sp. Marseille-Q0513]